MRYVVFKGTAGWGDRLQCFLLAIRYAKASGRYLVMDWRDQEWAHQGKENFEDFLELTGVKTFPFAGFLELFKQTGLALDTTPKVWQHHMDNPNFKDLLYKPLFCGVNHGNVMDDIANYRRDDFDEQVVVYCGTGYRSFAYADFAHITLKRWLSEEIKLYAKEKALQKGTYDVVHLRGGSKKWAGGKVALKTLAEQIDQQYPDLKTYFDAVHAHYTKLKGKGGSNRRLIILSDSKWLAEQWINTYQCGEYLDHGFQSGMEGSGIHEANEAQLKERGLSKYTINRESLRDYAIMLNARSIAFDSISLFSKMATQCAAHINPSWAFDQ